MRKMYFREASYFLDRVFFVLNTALPVNAIGVLQKRDAVL